ncbi:hypothetical protein EPYR_01942 [Erwinia pyrifoliae DSM 12163]|nr:hypothetical protein EJP617_29260 [Erwinia sp. Ejp617]CAY74322.1 hypothetical protein EPYR_01942 [Erwinia pyrifoliae DSM 12163]
MMNATGISIGLLLFPAQTRVTATLNRPDDVLFHSTGFRIC